LIEFSPPSSVAEPTEDSPSKTSTTETKKLREWLTVPVEPWDYIESSIGVLNAFDRVNEGAPLWTSYSGESTAINIARHLRPLILRFDKLAKNDDSREAAGEAADVRDRLAPEFARLLVEERLLDRHLGGANRSSLQIISDTCLDLLPDKTAKKQKDAVQKS
jgi:hypothetical protein